MSKGLQYQRTDRAIVNAFIKLVNQGSFEKLTIQQILDEALVSRNTFYSHYRDKYDIAEQLFEKLKKDFYQELRKNYTDIGKEWAGTDQFSQISRDAERTLQHFCNENSDVYRALSKIKTDRVDMSHFISQIFKKRYLAAPSNHRDDARDRHLELESDIYAAVYNTISNYCASASFHVPNMNKSICHAFLYSMGIIEEHHEKDAFDYIMKMEQSAKTQKDNYE